MLTNFYFQTYRSLAKEHWPLFEEAQDRLYAFCQEHRVAVGKDGARIILPRFVRMSIIGQEEADRFARLARGPARNDSLRRVQEAIGPLAKLFPHVSLPFNDIIYPRAERETYPEQLRLTFRDANARYKVGSTEQKALDALFSPVRDRMDAANITRIAIAQFERPLHTEVAAALRDSELSDLFKGKTFSFGEIVCETTAPQDTYYMKK